MSVRWDEDRMAVVAGLRRALNESGLSQAGFARAVGTSASRFSTYLSGQTTPSAVLLLRALRLGEGLRAAGERSCLTPIAAARGIRAALVDADPVWALKLILQCRDQLRRVMDDNDPGLLAAWEAGPGSTGAEDWDRLLAAVIGHEFDTRQLPQPTWTKSTVADGPWLFRSPFLTDDEVRAATPPWLSERKIFIAGRDLVTA